jgi:hypothetical protein
LTPEVGKELATILQMVSAWRVDYERFITPDGGDDFLVGDFASEIEEYIFPYLRRMLECGYINQKELSEFFDSCYVHVNELRETIGGASA